MSNPAHFIIKNGLLTKYVGFGGEVAIPEGVTEIGENAFSPEAPKLTAEQKLFRNNIVSVKFPNSVKKLEIAFLKIARLFVRLAFPTE